MTPLQDGQQTFLAVGFATMSIALPPMATSKPDSLQNLPRHQNDRHNHNWGTDNQGERHQARLDADSSGRPNLSKRLHDWRNEVLSAATGWLNDNGIKHSTKP
jgi:hypothetical protein